MISPLGVARPEPPAFNKGEAVLPGVGGFRSKSTDSDSRIVRKLMASIPFDSAGMIYEARGVSAMTGSRVELHLPEGSCFGAVPRICWQTTCVA
jgi:hypothetical protein